MVSCVSFVDAVVFSSFEQARGFLVKDGELGLKEGILAGSYAGFVNSFVVGPIELVKVTMQMQVGKKVYKNDWDCFKKILKNKITVPVNFNR